MMTLEQLKKATVETYLLEVDMGEGIKEKVIEGVVTAQLKDKVTEILVGSGDEDNLKQNIMKFALGTASDEVKLEILNTVNALEGINMFCGKHALNEEGRYLLIKEAFKTIIEPVMESLLSEFEGDTPSEQ